MIEGPWGRITVARIHWLVPRCRSSGSEPIFACTSLHSLKSSFTSALLPRLSQKAASHGVLRATRWFQRCHTFLILHGIAETFGLDAEIST